MSEEAVLNSGAIDVGLAVLGLFSGAGLMAFGIWLRGRQAERMASLKVESDAERARTEYERARKRSEIALAREVYVDYMGAARRIAIASGEFGRVAEHETISEASVLADRAYFRVELVASPDVRDKLERHFGRRAHGDPALALEELWSAMRTHLDELERELAEIG